MSLPNVLQNITALGRYPPWDIKSE